MKRKQHAELAEEELDVEDRSEEIDDLELDGGRS
jgi:hypothetical protein